MKSNITLSLLGNPNCGKTAVFNLLTGLDQKVSNYPGITVERKVAKIPFSDNLTLTLEDFPGAYSLLPQSLDEQIVSDQVLEWMKNPSTHPDAIVYVADITNLRRNLYFCSQLLSLNIPIILLLNMVDIADNDLVNINLLEKNMGVYKIIPFSAAKKTGMKSFKEAILSLNNYKNIEHHCMSLSSQYKKLVKPLTEKIKNIYNATNTVSEQLSFSLLCNRKQLECLNLNKTDLTEIVSIKTRILDNIDKSMKIHLKTMESDLRYAYIDDFLTSSEYKGIEDVSKISTSEKIDQLLTHKWLGPIIYVGLLYFIFQSIFTWATIPMDFIDSMIGNFGNYIYSIMPEGFLRNLMVDGIIAGVGAIVIFLPQILLLIFFMILLEDTGYMTRVTFIMDRFMRKMGLHGKSILPISI